MSALLPAAVYGLEVPAGDEPIPALPEYPAAFRLTMAAIDPSAEPEFTGSALNSTTPRATLKLIRVRQELDDDSEEDDSEDDEDDVDVGGLRALLNGAVSDDDDDDEDSDSDEEVNGGPSDPSKSKKARKEAAAKAIKEAVEGDSHDANGVNGTGTKGKGKAAALDDEDIGMLDAVIDDMDDEDVEEYVLCTLDPNQHYQQPLDITVGEDERVFFKVSGTHTIYLTGNYVIPVDDTPRRMYEDEDEEDEDYDLSPDDDELDEDLESDELDDIDDPRITELPDEEEAPKLIDAAAKSKGKNKRPAADSSDAEEPITLDSIMEKSLKTEPLPNGDVKLSKKQAKKLKNNAGQPVVSASKTETEIIKKEESPAVKKVQFAKELEQGPTGKVEPPKSNSKDKKQDKKDKKEKAAKKEEKSVKEEKSAKTEKSEKKEEPKKDTPSSKSSVSTKNVQGVTIEDRKVGSGPVAKKGDKVSMRYIGKLSDGKVFDANKKGKPFSFKLGTGEVIKGWDIGVEGISAGGERRIKVPAKLGYGNKPTPGIPANSELVFDVKCLEIQ